MTQPDTLSSRLDALEKLAKAASPGPWESQDNLAKVRPVNRTSPYALIASVGDGGGTVPNDIEICRRNATYIAAANPSAILALIGEVRDLLGRGK